MKTYKKKFWDAVTFKANRNPEDIRIDNIAEYAFSQGYAKGYIKGSLYGVLVTGAFGYMCYTWFRLGRNWDKLQVKSEKDIQEASKINEEVTKKYKEYVSNKKKSSSKKANVTRSEEQSKEDENKQE